METKHFSNNPNITKVDFDNGEVNEVSLITTGEILGHGMWLDEAGIDSFLQCVQGTQVKAYYKHSDENEALSSIGYFENFQKKQKDNGEYQIVGDFSALNAWKQANSKEYSTFFELAEKAPEVFGISVEALIKPAYYNTEGELKWLDDAEDELDDETKIYAFCDKVLAWSVVSTPATNPNGLFSQNKESNNMETKQLEEKINKLQEEVNTLMELSKELRNENESLTEENCELTDQVDKLEAKVESFEDGAEPTVLGAELQQPVSLSEQIADEKNWQKKYKLVLDNLSSFELRRN
jgi:regulator of replication initiation timing